MSRASRTCDQDRWSVLRHVLRITANRETSLPYAHDPEDIVTYDIRDPYHYKLADFFYAASGLPWQIRYLGKWGHPRGQRMLEFIRDSQPDA